MTSGKQPLRISSWHCRLLMGFCMLSCLFVGLSAFARAADGEVGEGDSLDLLLQSAVTRNQQLISAAAQSQRYNIRIPLVDNLSDPLLAFYYLDFPIGNISSGLTSPESQAQAGPATKVTLRSVRGSVLNGRDMVENQALWYQYLSEDLILQVTSQVRQSFFQLLFLDRMIAVTEQSLLTLDGVIESSDAGYAVGKLRQRDLLDAQSARYHLQAELLRLRQKRLSLALDLNYLCGQPSGTEVTPLRDPELTSENLPEPQHTLADFISGLHNHRPKVMGYQALGGRFKAMRSMIQMYFNREVRTEAMYEADSGLRAIKAEGADFYHRLIADLQRTMADLEKNRELAALYGRVLLPQRRQALAAGLADLQVGKAEYAQVLKTLLDLHQDQLVYDQSLADYMTNLAQLEGLSGLRVSW